MIKASSLFYAIVISIIIAIVTSSLILFAYLTHIEFQNAEIDQRLNLNSYSGLNLLMSKQTLVELDQQKTIDLFHSGNDSVFLSRRGWGAYEVLISRAVFKNTVKEQIAQVGYFPDSAKTYSIYLADEDKPLALCGKTIIKGVAYLPRSGVKRAYIEGQNFIGSVLIDGQTKQSEKNLPEFNKALTDNIQLMLTKKMVTETDSIIRTEGELSEDTLNNSFNNKSLVFVSDGSIKISGGTYTGNIAVISGKQITVSANAILKDILIVSPKIIFEKGFKGNLQAFASDSIIVNKEVSLYYPSVLGIVNNLKSPNNSVITLDENDTLSGNIFSCKNDLYPLKQAGIMIKEKSFVFGQVYSNGYADIKGTLYGSLMCTKIMLSTSSSVYEDHLLNAVIDRTKLSAHYVGINLVEESKTKKVVKWLN